eukprot:scaffold1659_cov371-Prasinococcus_capsulatus_cf.AAC.14
MLLLQAGSVVVGSTISSFPPGQDTRQLVILGIRSAGLIDGSLERAPGFALQNIQFSFSDQVLDDEAPVIQVKGKIYQSVQQCSSWTDDGVQVSDNIDTNLAASVEVTADPQWPLDTTIPGIHTIFYNGA